MSKIEVNTIDKASGSTVTVGGSGTNITLGTSGQTVTVPAGVTITNSGTATGFGISGTDWQTEKTADFTAVSREGYFINTTGGAVTVTLPASPSVGDEVDIVDSREQFGTNAVTLNRNSSNIEGAAANLTIDTQGAKRKFVYSGATRGWIATSISVTPDSYISATGGTATTSGNYKIHTFNSSSNFVVASLGNSGGGGVYASKVDYMVVAGGGAGHGKTTPGNFENGAGGGAGGFREGRVCASAYAQSPIGAPDGLTVAAQTYPITVGAGGAGGPLAGTAGSSSIFSTITSAGGGRGGGGGTNTGAAGGSGGGGAGWGGGSGNAGGAGNTPPVSPPQGNTGGTGSGNGNNASGSGGGGGAGAVGQNAPGDTGGDGGAGVSTQISGSGVYRAGGGGGAGGCKGCGQHGGGNGGSGSGDNGTAATANTGGGGGGSGPGTATGKAGGSGVVIIRYKYQG